MQTKDAHNIYIMELVYVTAESHEILGMSLIYNMLEHCANKRTDVVVFCSKMHMDSTGKVR